MNSEKIKVILKQKKKEKLEIEIPHLLTLILLKVYKKKFVNQNDELELVRIPLWTYHVIELFQFTMKFISNIKLLLIIVSIIAACVVYILLS